jgi:predicted dehydrogenase
VSLELFRLWGVFIRRSLFKWEVIPLFMENKYKVGIIGAGLNSVGGPDWDCNFPFAYSHAEAIRRNPRLSLSAVCDIDLEKARAAGEHLGVPYFGSWDEMLNSA